MKFPKFTTSTIILFFILVVGVAGFTFYFLEFIYALIKGYPCLRTGMFVILSAIIWGSFRYLTLNLPNWYNNN